MSPCPRCGASLQPARVGPVMLDGCDSCGGLWFDHEELTQLARAGGELLAAAEVTFEPSVGPAGGARGAMSCPRCSAALCPFEFRHTPGVTLDACPRCRGIWVDDQELAAIARRTAPTAAAASPQNVRERARRGVGFLLRLNCPNCGEANPADALVCWACGGVLQRRGGLLCPRCDGSLALTYADSTGLDVGTNLCLEHCGGCGGVWVGQAALSVLVDLPASWLQSWQDRLGGAPRGGAVHQERLLCPVCQVILDERAYAPDTAVYVDRCRRCRGTWLDTGELVLVRQVSIQQDVWGYSS